MNVTIEKGIPLPVGRVGGFSRQLHAMEVGDSILLPKANRQSFLTSAYRVPGKKFSTRSVDAQNFRIWRIK